MLPAFPHIRATRALAYGVELERPHDPLEFLVIRSAEVFYTQPRRPRMGRWRRRGTVGQYGERGSHMLEFESYSTRHIPLKQPPLRFKSLDTLSTSVRTSSTHRLGGYCQESIPVSNRPHR